MVFLPSATARLTFDIPDPTRAEDIAVHEAIVADPKVARMVMTVPHPYPAGELKARYEQWHAAHLAGESSLPFLLRLKVTGRVIGAMGSHRNEDGTQMEPGYLLAPEVWGQGLATEALGAFLKANLDQFPEITVVQSYHYADNPASGRVMEKVGMVCNGDILHPCLARDMLGEEGPYPAKVFRLPKDSPLWSQNR